MKIFVKKSDVIFSLEALKNIELPYGDYEGEPLNSEAVLQKFGIDI
ncbi:hypothetical protein [Rodentibacter myodis]|nr:hypothetical protein [Rodentibacter myodis]